MSGRPATAQRRSGHPAAAVNVLALLALLALPWTPAMAAPDGPVEIRVLSNRADLVSGGDALVELVLAPPVEPSEVAVLLDGRDVSALFQRRRDGRVIGLLDGLAVGDNALEARLADGRGARLVLTNHPRGGPVIAGPQIQPWICTTEAIYHDLGPAEDAQCNAPTRTRFRYRSSATGLMGDYDPASPPPDVATATTDQGAVVPFIVRIERGTMDRGIYEVAVLYDPEAPWAPWDPQPGWNGKLHVPFGGNCEPRHEQTGPPGDILPGDNETWIFHSVVIERALERGYAVATSGLNVLGQNCNHVVSAEALMMLKEHVVETYGEIRFTTAEGCSGGAMQQHVIAAGYPGLLDGIQPACSFPDFWSVGREALDCSLLDRVFDEADPVAFADPTVQAALAGHASAGVCRSRWDSAVAELSYADIWFNPQTACSLPAEQVYHPEDNPGGARCTIQDYGVSQWGRRAEDGFANRPYDNVGVQYGLAALEDGAVTAEKFVRLNELVGGADIDGAWQPARSSADPDAVRRAHRGGHVADGVRLADVPIIDIRGSSNHEVHSDVHSYIVRQRLDDAVGRHDNQIIWTNGPLQVPDQAAVEAAFDLLDRWLTAVEADTSGRSKAAKVVANKPADATDACWIQGQRVDDQATCAALFPSYANPRIAAGGPLSDDVVRCDLAPLDRDAHAGTFTDDQWARLQAAFPSGVCDYGASVRPRAEVWLDYADGPDGAPLRPAPTSTALRPGRERGGDDAGPAAAPEGPVLPATGGGGAALLALAVLGVAASVRRGGRR